MNPRSPRIRLIAFVALLLMAAAACGQKDGVALQGATGGLPPGTEIVDGQIVDAETGEVLGDASDLLGSSDGGLTGASGGLGSSSGGSLGGTSGGTSGSTGGTDGSTGGTDGSTGGTDGSTGNTGSTGGSDATGVTDNSVLFGTHAPLTGAAPVPSDSAQKGADVYYKWIAENGKKIHGRTVDVILKNDNYNPSQAVAVCKEMVEKDKVFALSGLAGTDQIQACARYAASVGVPYSSAGVTEIGLEGLPNYFAISMTYAEQGPLLADYILNKLGGKGEKNGMLRFDTPNFSDAHDSFANAMSSKGAKLAYDRAVSKGAGTTEAQSVVQEMKTAGIENVYVLTSPVWFLQVLQAANAQQYNPQWVGVGISMTFDTVATVSCRNGPSIDGAKFFSPFQAWSDRNRYSPDFEKAVRAIYPEENAGDDFMYVGWGAGQLGAAFLEKAGPNLTRGGFAAAIASTKNLKTDVFPPVTFSSSDHFGGTAVHVNEARCSDGRWHTIQANATDF